METSGGMQRTWRSKGVMILAAAALLVGGCDAEHDGPDINLDSAGAKIERGAEKVGKELDTAFTGIKTQVNESQIEGSLHRLRGMENVEVELSPQGEVHLTGTVATEESRRLAEEIARNIRGSLPCGTIWWQARLPILLLRIPFASNRFCDGGGSGIR